MRLLQRYPDYLIFFQELEQLNSHVHFDLTSREKDYMRAQRWKLMNARRRMNITPDTTGYTRRHSIEGLPQEINFKCAYYRSPPGGAEDQKYTASLLDDIYMSHDLKTEEYYAHVTNKALNHFSSLTEVEKHEFYYAFTRNGFKDALRTSKLPDGSKLTDLGNGKFTDKFGMIRDSHGPFWPIDYGPLHPTPQHTRSACTKPEILTTCNQGRSTISCHGTTSTTNVYEFF